MRRAAVDARKVRTITLYEAMTYLEGRLDEPWLVRRYRRELEGDVRNEHDEKDKRRRLGLMARIIERAGIDKFVAEMNELAMHYRENKPRSLAPPSAGADAKTCKNNAEPAARRLN